MGKIQVSAQYDYVQGHLRYGSEHLIVDADEWAELTVEQKLEKLREEGEFVLDDYSMEDRGDLMADTLREESI